MIEEKAKYRKLLAKRSPTKLIEVLKETLETMDFVVFAYLYGSLLSWLKGSTLPPGDVDLAIYTEESIPAPKAELEVMARLSQATGLPQEVFDVRVINEAPPYWAVKVMQEGMLLFHRDKDARLYDFMEKMARERRQLLFLEEAYGP
ncbi:MAG: hypothetical protein DRI91_06155 [Aquificota bacterium]|nr:MAG: hypothetical protein DRI91_06155 [Aquificota bacterium]